MSDTTTANNEQQVAVLDQFPDKINNIKKALENLVETESKVAGLKEKYTGITIIDENDEDGYKVAREAKSILVKTRTSSEDDRKVALKPIDELRDTVHTRFMSVQTDLKTVEGPISSRIKEIDDIEKKKKEDARLAEEQKVEDRRNELIKNGMVFDEVSGYYVIKAPELGIAETSIGIVDIRTMSDDLYKNFLQMVVDKSSKITAEKERLAEVERLRLEEENKQKLKEQQEFKKQQQLLQEQQAEMKRQQGELKLQQQQLGKAKHDAELREQQAEQNRINGIIRHRSAVLTGIGLTYNAQGDSFDYTGEVLVADAPAIADHNDTAWLALIETLKTTIAAKKLAAEEFLKDQQKKEKDRLELQEKERLAGLSDKQRLQEYVDALLAIPVPELKTKTWKARAGSVRDFITDNRPA